MNWNSSHIMLSLEEKYYEQKKRNPRSVSNCETKKEIGHLYSPCLTDSLLHLFCQLSSKVRYCTAAGVNL